MAWTNRDRHSTMYANVIPTEQYKLTNEELWSAASTSFGITNPVCLPQILRNQAVANRRRREGHAAADLSNGTRRDFSRRCHDDDGRVAAGMSESWPAMSDSESGFLTNHSRSGPTIIRDYSRRPRRGCARECPGMGGPCKLELFNSAKPVGTGAHSHMIAGVAARRSCGLEVPSAAQACVTVAKRDGPPAVREPRRMQLSCKRQKPILDAHGPCEQAGPVGWGKRVTCDELIQVPAARTARGEPTSRASANSPRVWYCMRRCFHRWPRCGSGCSHRIPCNSRSDSGSILPATTSSSWRLRTSSRAEPLGHSSSVACRSAALPATRRPFTHWRPPTAADSRTLMLLTLTTILLYKLVPGKRAAWLSILAVYASGFTALYYKAWDWAQKAFWEADPTIRYCLIGLVVAGSIGGESGHACHGAIILTLPSPPAPLIDPSCTPGPLAIWVVAACSIFGSIRSTLARFRCIEPHRTILCR